MAAFSREFGKLTLSGLCREFGKLTLTKPPPSKDVPLPLVESSIPHQTAANVKWPIFIGKDVQTAAKGTDVYLGEAA